MHGHALPWPDPKRKKSSAAPSPTAATAPITKWPARISGRRIANPLQAAAELARYRDAAQRLVRTAWAQQRIRLLADALQRNGSLSGEEIFELIL